mmetsp:Transcript_39769/g.82692  ORF Transcript_39769/g.82692 Transcript_39769/m.82692 type:complete len:233 (-) Transcript_39769:126-824(-)
MDPISNTVGEGSNHSSQRHDAARATKIPAPEHIVTRFFCENVVPGANHTCAMLRKQALENKNSRRKLDKPKDENRGFSLEYNRILQMAVQRGLIRLETAQRAGAVERVQNYILQKGREYKERVMICLPTQIRQEMLDTAIRFEQQMGCGGIWRSLVAFQPPGSTEPRQQVSCLDRNNLDHDCNEIQHRLNSDSIKQQFLLQLVDLDKFCSFNTTLMFQQDSELEWQQFFQSL